MIKTFKFDKRHVVFVGDIHGDFRALARITALYDDSLIFQVGDFGAGFCRRTELERKLCYHIAKSAKEHDNSIVAIRGNHDDDSYFDGSLWGDQTITLLPDNCVVQAVGHSIFCTGGATSIDRTVRAAGIDWFPGEKTKIDLQLASQLRDINIVVTHTAPYGFSPHTLNSFVERWIACDPDLRHELDEERKLLTQMHDVIVANNPVQHWVYGHFHHSAIETVGSVTQRCIDINQHWSPDAFPLIGQSSLA